MHVAAAEVCGAEKYKISYLCRNATICRSRIRQTQIMWISLNGRRWVIHHTLRLIWAILSWTNFSMLWLLYFDENSAHSVVMYGRKTSCSNEFGHTSKSNLKMTSGHTSPVSFYFISSSDNNEEVFQILLLSTNSMKIAWPKSISKVKVTSLIKNVKSKWLCFDRIKISLTYFCSTFLGTRTPIIVYSVWPVVKLYIRHQLTSNCHTNLLEEYLLTNGIAVPRWQWQSME